MLSKFGEALELLFANFLLFSSIVLTVWLPGNLLVNYLTFNVLSEDDVIGLVRLTMWIEGIFGPLYIGALIYALSRLKQGERPTYGKAISIGFRK